MPHSFSCPQLPLSAPSPSRQPPATACRWQRRPLTRARQACSGRAALGRREAPAVRRGDVAGNRAEPPGARALRSAARARLARPEVTSLEGVPGAWRGRGGRRRDPRGGAWRRRMRVEKGAWFLQAPPTAAGSHGPEVAVPEWSLAEVALAGICGFRCGHLAAAIGVPGLGQGQVRCAPVVHRERSGWGDPAIFLPSSLRLDPTPACLRRGGKGLTGHSSDGSLQLAKPCAWFSDFPAASVI